MSFAERYGPWALILGASEGVGAEYARAMAERGVNVALLARRQSALDAVAADIRAATGVSTRTIALDLAAPDAMANIAAATDDLVVGMVMYCAGADPGYGPFLAGPVEAPLALVHRNCVVPMQVCHHFAGPMVTRGGGGIMLVSSAGGLVGGPNMVAYGASKAFDIVFGEALWAELHDQGVDVLSLVLGVTDTPALRRTLAARGLLDSPDDTTPIPGAATPEQVVQRALDHLTDGPTCFATEQLDQTALRMGAMSRSDAVKALIASVSSGVMHNRA